MPQVSIIVLTYNPDIAKLRRTLTAAARQKDVEFEILISDDGSATKDFSFLQTMDLPNCRLLENPQNQGTVKNCLTAIQEAAGEYVFLTSPGDYLFDDHTMADFYRFAKHHNAPLCFGNAVYYCAQQDQVLLTRQYGIPYRPGMYDGAASKTAKAHFFGGNWIIGAAYFRQRATALTYFSQLADVSIYVEDNTSTTFAMADNIGLRFYDRNIVWYEDGTGVSTGASEKWKLRIAQDIGNAYRLLKQLHPNDPYVDQAWHDATEPDRKKRLIYKLTHHPLITCKVLLGRKFAPKPPVVCDPNQLEQLKQLCAMKE